MLNNLRQKNNNLIRKFELEKNNDMLERHKLISVLLSRDDCFFKIPMDDALSILRDLGQNKEESLETYKHLTSFAEFKKVNTDDNK